MHKEWYSRGYLPHFDHPGLLQMITFRLADALPAALFNTLQEAGKDVSDAQKRRKTEAFLDAGHGSCHLHDSQIASLVEATLLHFDGVRYQLLAWVVMPNHIHALVEIRNEYRLPEIVHSWKSYTAKEANRILGRSGRFWQPDYFDRFIRDSRHFESVICYIHGNPVKAGLVSRPEDWPYSSAARGMGSEERNAVKDGS